MGALTRAREEATRALDLARRLERRRDEGEALWLLARSSAAKEQGAALDYAREALRLFEQVEHSETERVREYVERGGTAGENR